MATTATGTATETATKPGPQTSNNVPVSFHAAAVVWLAGMVVFAHALPHAYDAAVQEDRLVEWWTAALFACAGVVRLIAAMRTRRIFDALVALFCIFVAGEEISWGQRLLGFTPPAYFLAHNAQQEFSLHNFADVFGKPKGVLMLALAGFGMALPAVQRFARGRNLLDRIGASPPPASLLPWFAAAIALLLWYPVDFTGEWIEAFAGALFLVSSPVRHALAFPATLVAAAALTGMSSATVRPNPALVACARSETDAVLSDIARSLQSQHALLYRRVHKRVQSALEDNYFASDLSRFRRVQCEGEERGAALKRRRYAIDPWGMAYWVRSEPDENGVTITVYSFGPNRKRDSEPGDPDAGDDVLRVGRVPL